MGLTGNNTIVFVKISQFSFLLFLLFYALSAIYYPGGTFAEPQKKGFSFTENYFCDLLDDTTYLFQDNPAKLYARIALGFLCLGIFIFWYGLPNLMKKKNIFIHLMRFLGMLSMLLVVFLNAANHDILTRVSGIIGLSALLMFLVKLGYMGFIKLMLYGLICLLLIVLNFYMYETRNLVNALPWVQKISMLLGLGWFIAVQHSLSNESA